MAEIEFVNRKMAEAEAARFIGLQGASGESKVESWFALQAVADQIGPVSNVGRRGMSWTTSHGSGIYKLHATCRDGMVETSTGAPNTLAEARKPANLDKAERTFIRKVNERGGFARNRRPVGTTAILVEAVSASAEGREWLERTATADKSLQAIVRVADAYGREGVNPRASLSAHMILIKFDNRAELIREHTSTDEARGKAITLNGFGEKRNITHVPPSRVATLAIRAGVTRSEARIILRALIEGRSRTKLIRAITEGAKMLDAMEEARDKFSSRAAA